MVKNFSGTLFLIIGNSGSGKDSIISGIIEKFPPGLMQIVSPKRYITRPPSEFERNISLTTEQFKEMEKNGKFALKWHIYDLHYAIPTEIEKWLEKGHPVIINVSRTIVKDAKKKYKNVRVIFVEVPFEITYQRIKNRKRESEDLLKRRIKRAQKNQKFPEADFVVDNSGDLNEAISQCLTYLVQVVRLKNKEK
jgi:ribose 1,5-bisphosphokinase